MITVTLKLPAAALGIYSEQYIRRELSLEPEDVVIFEPARHPEVIVDVPHDWGTEHEYARIGENAMYNQTTEIISQQIRRLLNLSENVDILVRFV